MDGHYNTREKERECEQSSVIQVAEWKSCIHKINSYVKKQQIYVYKLENNQSIDR